jgi:hypothetical protein
VVQHYTVLHDVLKKTKQGRVIWAKWQNLPPIVFNNANNNCGTQIVDT